MIYDGQLMAVFEGQSREQNEQQEEQDSSKRTNYSPTCLLAKVTKLVANCQPVCACISTVCKRHHCRCCCGCCCVHRQRHLQPYTLVSMSAVILDYMKLNVLSRWYIFEFTNHELDPRLGLMDYDIILYYIEFHLQTNWY